MGLKVGILGLSQSSRHLAPWDRKGWELWGLAWDTERYRFARAFEPHDLADLRATYPNLPAYLDKIQHCTRLYMAQPCLPLAVRYPVEDVIGTVGDYLCSSVAYMLALAIHEGAEEIGLYGVDMKGDKDEYAYQRPNCEYLIGFARGRGIEVHIPETSPLCKFVSPHDRDYAGRYGVTK